MSQVEGFAHLRVHSGFSFLEGTARVEEIVEAAARTGVKAVGLTDTDGLFAVVPFFKACREAGVKPVIGIELTGRLNGRDKAGPSLGGSGFSGSGGRSGRVTLLARNLSGYSEISRLATSRRLDQDFSLPSAVEGVSENVYILSDDPELLALAAGRKNARAALPAAPGAEGRRERWRLRRAARRLGLKTAAAGPVFFLRPKDHFIHRVLRAIGERKTVGTLSAGETEPAHAWFAPPQEVKRIFTGDPAPVEEAAAIAADCRVELDLNARRLPAFPLPPGEDSAGFLKRAAFEGLRKRGLEPAYAERAAKQLEYELYVVLQRGLADYFLVCWDIVRFAAGRGMKSVGRGSAGNSVLSYALGITHINPLKMRMFFERFLNPGREQLPDIDIDFATEDRDVVLDYIFEKYGSERVAMIGAYNTFKARGAVREVAKALGIPESEFGPAVRRIPFFAGLGRLREISAVSPGAAGLDCGAEPLKSVLPAARRLEGLPRHMSAHPCGVVISPSPVTGMIPLQRCAKGYEITQWSMDEIEEAGFLKLDVIGQKGLAVIRDAEAAVSADGPGRKSPALPAGAPASLKAREAGSAAAASTPDCSRDSGADLPVDCSRDPASDSPLGYSQDPAARKIISEGRTVGCFYIESPVMLQLLEQARCQDIEVLTALSSIIRPGVSSYGGKRLYLSRHLGLEPVERIHPVVDEVLEDTYGCLIYQEQVIRLAVAVSGMSYAEADGLRRCMSYKSKRDESMEQYRLPFVRGALARGIPRRVAEGVFKWISSFSGYAFCKAHSASFAVESFESAYWKANYPAEFMAAVISNGGGYYGTGEYVEEARRIGIEILPPCVNSSGFRTEGRSHRAHGCDGGSLGRAHGRDEDSRRHSGGKGAALGPDSRTGGGAGPAGRRDGGESAEAEKHAGAIRVGLSHVKGLSADSAKRIIGGRPYRSLAGFMAAARLPYREVETLIHCGAMSSLGRSRPRLLWEYHILKSEGQEERASALIEKLPALPGYGLPRRVAMEMEVLGFAVSAHPLAMFKSAVSGLSKRRALIGSLDLGRWEGRRVEMAGWKVAAGGARTTGGGGEMIFVTFSDPAGRFETVFFPDAYKRCALELAKGRGLFHIRGKAQREFGAATLVADSLKFIGAG